MDANNIHMNNMRKVMLKMALESGVVSAEDIGICTIKADSVAEAFDSVLYALDIAGVESAPRGKKIKELTNVCITVKNPRARIISCPERKFSSSYALGEFAWYMSGRNDLAMMDYYSKMQKQFSDDGFTINSAYGYRIFSGMHPQIPFNQWENVIRLLKEDPDTRQAVIHLHTPNNKKTKDEVCTMSLQFLLRDNKLNLITTMRSNDVVLGFTYDAFAFTMIQELMANEVGAELGVYYHNVGSMHIYENAFGLLNNGSYSELPAMEPIKLIVSKGGMDEFIKTEAAFRAAVDKRQSRQLCVATWEKDWLDQLLHNTDVTEVMEMNEFQAWYMHAFAIKALKELGSRKKQMNKLLNRLHAAGYETLADILMLECGFSQGGNKIIIEGPDGVGKSTYIENMFVGTEDSNNDLSMYHVRHFTKASNRFGYFKNYSLHVSSDIDEINDRSFISEIVYGSLLRSEVNLSKEQISWLFDKYKQKKTKFVFIVAMNEEQEEELCRRVSGHYHKKDKEEQDVRNNILKINYGYKTVAERVKKLGFEIEMIGIE